MRPTNFFFLCSTICFWSFFKIVYVCESQGQETKGIAEVKKNDTWDHRSRLAHSYYENFVANGKSLIRGDCLVRIKETWDSVNVEKEPNFQGAIIEDISWIRLRFDHESGSILFAKTTDQNRLDMNLHDPDTGDLGRISEFESLFGYRADLNSRTLFKRGLINQFPVKDLDELISLPERDLFPDLRCPGWWGRQFPKLSSIEESLSFREANKFKYRITEVRKQLKFAITSVIHRNRIASIRTSPWIKIHCCQFVMAT